MASTTEKQPTATSAPESCLCLETHKDVNEDLRARVFSKPSPLAEKPVAEEQSTTKGNTTAAMTKETAPGATTDSAAETSNVPQAAKLPSNGEAEKLALPAKESAKEPTKEANNTPSTPVEKPATNHTATATAAVTKVPATKAPDTKASDTKAPAPATAAKKPPTLQRSSRPPSAQPRQPAAPRPMSSRPKSSPPLSHRLYPL
jgi:hypothetical protein